MPTYPLSTLAPTITAAGISAPPFSDILASLTASAQAIFGQDVYVTPDSQDGQLIGVYSLAQSQVNDAVIAAYNAYPPSTAVGAGLSAVVKINNLNRKSASNSSAPVMIVGVAGTQIVGGLLSDPNGNQWALPSVVSIPYTGQITVTAVCQTAGSVAAAVGVIGNPDNGGSILTPVPGWQTASNTDTATLGAPVELDPQLRLRQAGGTNAAAITPRESIEAAILAIPGVVEAVVNENEQDVVDMNGIPGHTISAVVAGGDVNAIATAIAQKKSEGTGTYGTTSIVVFDSRGVPDTINFFELETVPIFVAITLQPLSGYLVTTGNLVIGSIITQLNSFVPGQDVHLDDLGGPAKLSGDAATISSGLSQLQLDALSKTYIVRSLTFGLSTAALATADVPIAFYAQATCAAANVTLNLTTA